MASRRQALPAAPPADEDSVRAQAQRALQQLSGPRPGAALAQARALLPTLRNLRAFELMVPLAEALSRLAPEDARSRCLYAQCLVETGQASVAVAVLDALQATLPATDPLALEVAGLRGRAWKQIFLDLGPGHRRQARAALGQAVAAYRQAYDAAPAQAAWQGVNLLSLLGRARREGWAGLAPDLDPAVLAPRLVQQLQAMPPAQRDEWHDATLAEAMLGQALASGDLGPVEQQLRRYLLAPQVQAFQVASTLRQFSQVWALQDLVPGGPGHALRDAAALRRAQGLVEVLRMRLLQLPGGGLVLPAAQVRQGPARRQRPPPPPAADPAVRMLARGRRSGHGQAAEPAAEPATPSPAPPSGQLEAILGQQGPMTFAWWQAGVAAARSVAVVRQRLGQRLGTGFVVRAGDFGLKPASAKLLLTNFHVVNADGQTPGIRPDQAEVVFEADNPQRAYRVTELVWSSPVAEHDAALLRLDGLPARIAALPLCPQLPAVPSPAGAAAPRVYIIGYPGGRELSFSFQDNELIDHEGPPAGKPQVPGVCRVHYRAPTEGGNSGSPVFDAQAWQVLALHHKGGRLGMPRLNGLAGTYAANEGLALGSLVAAVKAAQQP